MSTKLGVNPFESPASKPVIFPGDSIPPESQKAADPTQDQNPNQNQEPDMTARNSRPKAKSTQRSLRIPRNRQELLKALRTVREVDAADISKKLWNCRLKRFSLLEWNTSGRTPSLNLIGLDISHGFSMKNLSYRLGPVSARGWKVTLLDVQLRKGV
jgi:hypothetical protein